MTNYAQSSQFKDKISIQLNKWDDGSQIICKHLILTRKKKLSNLLHACSHNRLWYWSLVKCILPILQLILGNSSMQLWALHLGSTSFYWFYDQRSRLSPWQLMYHLVHKVTSGVIWSCDTVVGKISGSQKQEWEELSSRKKRYDL